MSDHTSTYRFVDMLGDADDQSLAFLDDFIEGLGMQSWRVHEGAPLGPLVPQEPKISLRKDNPGVRLSSLLGNTKNMLIVERSFMEIIAASCTNEIEFINFTIIDHRKRVLTKDYFLVNPLGALDCLDVTRSDIDWSKKDPTKILGINEAVLDRAKMKGAPELFRIKEEPTMYVFGPKLADAMRAHKPKLTNIGWTPLRFADEL